MSIREQELAEEMAEYLRWECLRGRVWVKDNYQCNIDQLFFDPQGNPPNPKGFQLVWEKLAALYPEQSVYIKFHKGVSSWSCKISTLFKASKVIEGPTRFHAFYEAVVAMKKGGKDENNH